MKIFLEIGSKLSSETTTMQLVNKEQIKAWDLYTIEQKSITSLALMTDASKVFTNWFQTLYYDKSRTIDIICGAGNNGGDGLCVGKLLQELEYDVRLHLYLFSERQSIDNKIHQAQTSNLNVYSVPELPKIESRSIVVDALLGSGISGNLKGANLSLVTAINALTNTIISIDIPSGLNPDAHTNGNFVRSDHLLSFEVPKLAFFIEEHYPQLNQWDYRPIGLDQSYLKTIETPYHYLNYKFIKSLLLTRLRTESKFSFGFGQLCGGSEGMFGAIILSARAAMKCGIGRLATNLPSCYIANYISAVPESMATHPLEGNESRLTKFSLLSKRINTVAVGPGLGKHESATNYMSEVLSTVKDSLILDADALNVIANQSWQDRIPRNSIITPHKQEFEALFGQCENHYERILLQRKKAQELSIYIILKGAFTSIVCPDGNCYFNNTGNVGMATAGSGDVLTGMILAFKAQGYSERAACLLAVYAHGSSGDLAAQKYGQLSVIASSILEFIPETLKNLHE